MIYYIKLFLMFTFIPALMFFGEMWIQSACQYERGNIIKNVIGTTGIVRRCGLFGVIDVHTAHGEVIWYQDEVSQ